MKKIISIAIIILMLIVFSITNVYATNILDTNSIKNNSSDHVNSMSKEELEKAIEKVNEDMNVEFKIEGDKIIISSEGKEYSMIYNLEGNPKFISRAVIKENMNMDEYEVETQNLLLGILGFIIVGIDKGIETENVAFYVLLSLYNNLDWEEAEIIEENQFDAMEMAAKVYDKETIIEDDLYKLTIKKVSNTESEYIIESNYEVKIDEDFSIIQDYNFEDIVPTNEILQNVQIARNEFFQETTNEQISLNETLQWIENKLPENFDIPENLDILEIPQTGKTLQSEDILWIILLSSVVVFILYCIYDKRKNGKL